MRSSESMRFAASRLPNRLTSVGSSEAVIQSSAPSTPEQLHAEHGAGRRRAGTEVGDTRRGAVEREDAVSSDVEFHASAAPHSRKRPHGLMRRTPHSCQIRKVPHAPTSDASADTPIRARPRIAAPCRALPRADGSYLRGDDGTCSVSVARLILRASAVAPR